MEQINPRAAGIDAGSRTHLVAVPPGCDETPIRSFGCLTPDLHEMARWLIACGIETVAIESTGVYWIPVAQVLEPYGLDVVLVDARQVKNVPGRKKTDVHDCQWIRKLHAFGLLKGAFRPQRQIQTLRSYWRQRAGLVSAYTKQIQLMQKALEQMNLQLHKVLSDISGLTGMQIIRSIIAGEHNPQLLAEMKQANVKSSTEQIVKALTGDYHEEHLFALRQAVELYDVFQEKIEDCDREIERYMSSLDSKADSSTYEGKSQSRRRRSEPRFDLSRELYRISGVDLTQIDGISALTAQTIISECGLDMSPFPTEKHFCSWLGLSPNNELTGGKIKRRRTKKVVNRAALAFRLAANSLHRSSSYLGAYLRRMKARIGAPKAITATAHKLARLVYRMLKYGMKFVDQGQEYYEKQQRERSLRFLRKRAKTLGFDLVVTETGVVVS
jgi:transposase